MPADLWNFALSRYSQPGMETLCLELQAQGFDVCLLLCLLWLEQRQIEASELRLHQLQQCAIDWQQQVLESLRKLRQQWRNPSQTDPALAALREQVKQLELAAEQELLGRLQAIGQKWQAADNAAAWLELLPLSPTARRQLRAITTVD